MNFTPIMLQDPSTEKVRLRRSKRSHEYVVASNFATIPTNHTQSRIMRNAHINTRRSIQSIKEEDEYDTDDDDHIPKTPIDNGEQEEDDDENIPLAMLAFRKGFVVPDKVENVYPLIQHVPQVTPFSNFKNNNLQMHSCYNYQHPMYNVSTISQPMHPSEKYPQHRQFYQLNRNYSYESSSSSVSSLSSSSETLPSNLPNRAHHTAPLANNAPAYYRRRSFCN